MKDSAGIAILTLAGPIFAFIIVLGMLANKGLISAPSANGTKGIEITRTQNNTTHNNIKNNKTDF